MNVRGWVHILGSDRYGWLEGLCRSRYHDTTQWLYEVEPA